MSKTATKTAVKKNDYGKWKKAYGIFTAVSVPVSFAYAVYLYVATLYSSIIISFNEMVGYLSYDNANIHDFADNVAYQKDILAMLTMIPASEVMVFIPILSVLATTIVLYLVSLTLRKDEKQKAVIYFLSVFIMLMVNTFFLVFVTGIQTNMLKILAIMSVVDLWVISDKIRTTFWKKDKQK